MAQVRGQLREKDASLEALQAIVDKLEKARRLADKKHLLQLKELNKRCGAVCYGAQAQRGTGGGLAREAGARVDVGRVVRAGQASHAQHPWQVLYGALLAALSPSTRALSLSVAQPHYGSYGSRPLPNQLRLKIRASRVSIAPQPHINKSRSKTGPAGIALCCSDSRTSRRSGRLWRRTRGR